MCYSANRAYGQQFARRKKTLIRRTNQLAQLCQADIALIIRKNNRYYTYRSLVDKDWPPTRAEIVCHWIQVSDRITKEVQEKTYPLPIEMSPEDFPSTKSTVRFSECLKNADNQSATTQVNSDRVDGAVFEDVKNADDQSATTQVDCDKVEKRSQSHFFNTILH